MTSHEINTTKEPCNTFNQKTPEKEVLIPGGSIPEESKNQCILSNESNSTENIEANPKIGSNGASKVVETSIHAKNKELNGSKELNPINESKLTSPNESIQDKGAANHQHFEKSTFDESSFRSDSSEFKKLKSKLDTEAEIAAMIAFQQYVEDQKVLRLPN